MRKLGKNKKGFSTVMAVAGGIIGLMFLFVFAFIFMEKLTDDSILTANSLGANATDRLEGNFSAGVDEVSAQIPSIFSIAVFVLVIVVLFIAYNVARRNGLVGTTGTIG